MNTPGEMRILPVNEPRGILPGGCYPPWPPERFPPPEPEPDGSDLGAAIDWMTYSHEQLYPMATQGLDLAGANTVAAKWAEIGEKLQEIGVDLQRAIARAEGGWSGDAAELAREAATKLVKWAEDTGERANEACGCVSRQAEIAQRASMAMPEPVKQPEPPPLCGTPDLDKPMGPAGGGTAAMSASAPSPFASGSFADAGELSQAPWGTQERARAAHREAADVMRRMQRESFEVYGTVPWFVPPKRREDDPKRRPDDDHTRRRRADEPDPTTRSAGAAAAAAPGAGGFAGGGAAAPGAGGSQLGAGTQYGVGAGQPGPGAAPAAAAAGGAGMPRGGMGGMPMGAMGSMGGGSRGDDGESRKGASFLQGEKGVFDPVDDIHEMLLGVVDDDEPPQRRR